MDIDQISTLIGSLGFTIVACCFMGWLYVKFNETLKELTIAITKLKTKFDDHVNNMEGNGTE